MSLPSRPSLHPTTLSGSGGGSSGGVGGGSSGTSANATHQRQRQYAHLAAQLAQLHARLADLENLVRMTGVQAGDVRGLGGWMGGLFMASSRVLGEESVAGSIGAKEAEAARKRADEVLGGKHDAEAGEEREESVE